MRWLALAISLLLATPAAADMYQDASNAKVPDARLNLHVGNYRSPADFDPLCDGRTTDAEITAKTAHDCTMAIRSALAAAKQVRLPTGNFYITDKLTVTNNQVLTGDGRATRIRLRDTFSPAADAVIKFDYSGNDLYGAEVRDLSVIFDQPSDAASRAAATSLGTCNSNPGGTICKYPPAILTTAGIERARALNVRVERAWDGFAGSCSTILTVNNPGGTCNNGIFWMENIEMSALNVGLWFDGVLDEGHLKGFHFYLFGIQDGTGLSNVFIDGNTYCAKFGRWDNFHGHDVFCHRGHIQINNPLAALSLVDLSFDTNAMLEVINSKRVDVVNMHSSLDNTPPAGVCSLKTSGGTVRITNLFVQNAITKVLCINGGIAEINGGQIGAFADQTSVAVTAGYLTLNNVSLVVPAANRSAPAILQTGGGLRLFGVSSGGPVGSTGVLVQLATDEGSIESSHFSGWPVSLGCGFTGGYCFTTNYGYYDLGDQMITIPAITGVLPSFATPGNSVLTVAGSGGGYYLRGNFVEGEADLTFSTNAYTTASGPFRVKVVGMPPITPGWAVGCSIHLLTFFALTSVPACTVYSTGFEFTKPNNLAATTAVSTTEVPPSWGGMGMRLSWRYRIR